MHSLMYGKRPHKRILLLDIRAQLRKSRFAGRSTVYIKLLCGICILGSLAMSKDVQKCGLAGTARAHEG